MYVAGIIPSHVYGANLGLRIIDGVIDVELQVNQKYRSSDSNPKIRLELKHPQNNVNKESAINSFIDFITLSTSGMFDEIKRSFDKSDVIQEPLQRAKIHTRKRLVTYSKQLQEKLKDKPLADTIRLILDSLNNYR